MNVKKFYEGSNYKKLFILPLILLIISVFFISQVKLGIDFAGGTRITVATDSKIDITPLENSLKSEYSFNDLSIRESTGVNTRVYIEFASEQNLENIKSTGTEEQYIRAREEFKTKLIQTITKSTGTSEENISLEEVGASTGEIFWKQALNAILLGFFFIAIIIFIMYRNLIASLAIIQSTIFDVIVGIAAIGFFGIPLSLVSVAPLLMLIGYSIDTNIMLTERVLKRKEGTAVDRTASAFWTGMTITSSTMATMAAMMIISYLTNMETMFNISLIILFGLFGDLFSTWITNAGILIWHLRKKS